MKSHYAKAIIAVFILSFVILSAGARPVFALSDAGENALTPPVPAEVTEDKAFVRADHDNKAKRVATLEEGDALDLLAEWDGGDAFPWYKVDTDEGEGWIYGQTLRRLDGKPAAAQTAPEPGGETAAPRAGIVSAEGDFVTVIAKGDGVNRDKALESAWIEAVRLAVGTVI